MGDLASLIAVLDPEVVLHSDGGGFVSAARRPVIGADRVARFLLGVPRLAPGAQIAPALTPDGLGFFVTLDGAAHSVITLRRPGRPDRRRVDHAQPREAHPVGLIGHGIR